MGYLYFLTNPRMPGLVKIGRSADPDFRVLDLSAATGVPAAFDIRHKIEAEDDAALECLVHSALAPFRVSSRKEFFELPLAYAIKTAEAAICGAELAERTLNADLVVMVRTPAELGDAVRSSRKVRGLTQQGLAKAVGCGPRVIAEIETGKATAQIGIVMRICNELGITLSVPR